MATRSLGSLTLDLIARTGGWEQGMDRAARTADKRMKEIERRAKVAGTVIGAAIATGVTLAGAALIGLTKQAIDSADAIRDMSIRVGASTETLSAYAYAAKQTGTDIDELGKGLLRLSKNATAALDPKSRQANLFEALLGPGFREQIRDIEVLLPAVADKFAQMEDSVQKTALAQELFGKSGANLMEFLNSGAQGLDEFTQKARELGIIIDQETADAADRFNDTLGDMRELASGLGIQIASKLLKSLAETAENFRDLVKEGDLANNIVSVLTGTMRAGIWIIDQYNNAVSRTAIAMQVMAEASAGAQEVLRNVGFGGAFDEGSVSEGFDKIKQAFANGQKELDALIAGQASRRNSQAGGAPSGPDTFGLFVPTPAEIRRREAQAKRLAGFFENPTGRTPGSAGKSDAEREAERMKRAYESLGASMRERIALFNTEGEAAKVAYQIQNEDLSKLDATTRAYVQTLQQKALADAQQYDAMVKLREENKARMDAAAEESDRINRGLQAGKELLSDLQFELELMKMTNAERATAIQLRGLEAEAVAEYGEAIIQANRDIDKAMKEIEFMDGMRDSFAGFFEDMMSGTKSIKDAFSDMISNITSMISRFVAQRLVEQMFGDFGSGQSGSGGGWVQAIASLFAGGKAGGGWAAANRMYEVNERGMEMASVNGRDYLLTGNKPVQITPNHRLGGGSMAITQNFINPRMNDLQTDSQKSRYEARKAQRSMARA